jgi:hypothetical protein
MQLDTQKSISAALSAITATLLGTGAAAAPGATTVDSSILLYSETGRVKLAEGVFDYGRNLSETRSIGVRLTLDALTGASPNGATPSSAIQTFTSPSGGGSYSVSAGTIPLDDTFQDMRGALDLSLRESLDRITFLNVGGHLSFERDYMSFGANVGITRDLNRKNTTLGVSAAYSHDIVSPYGGAPDPFASMPPPDGDDDGEGEDEGEDEGPSESKDIVDGVVTLTQVIDRKTIVRVNYSLSWSTGYLNDPYKIVSVVYDRDTATPGEPANYLYESRPDTRSKQAIFGDVRRSIAGSALDLSYRYFWDDWGVTSHTADVSLRLPVGSEHYIEPRFRWYRQSEADFYTPYLVDGQVFPNHASADSRLAEFDAYTYGLRWGFPVATDFRMSLTAEYYTQKGTRGPPDNFGVLSQYELFPELDAFMLRVGFSHGF